MKATGSIDPAALARWWMETYKPEDGRTSYPKYREMSSMCRDLYKYVGQGGGYDPRNNQQWVRVMIPKNGDVDAALAELNLFLPYIRPTNGYKHVSVQEYTLSEYGMYELREYGEGDVRLVRTTYGRESDEGRFGSWMDALAYVRLNHWSGLDN